MSIDLISSHEIAGTCCKLNYATVQFFGSLDCINVRHHCDE